MLLTLLPPRRLGLGHTDPQFVSLANATDIWLAGRSALHVVAGLQSTFVLLDNGCMIGFGNNANGNLGYNTTDSSIIDPLALGCIRFAYNVSALPYLTLAPTHSPTHSPTHAPTHSSLTTTSSSPTAVAADSSLPIIIGSVVATLFAFLLAIVLFVRLRRRLRRLRRLPASHAQSPRHSQVHHGIYKSMPIPRSPRSSRHSARSNYVQMPAMTVSTSSSVVDGYGVLPSEGGQ